MNLGFIRCLIIKPIANKEVSKPAIVVQMIFVSFSCHCSVNSKLQMIPFDDTLFY